MMHYLMTNRSLSLKTETESTKRLDFVTPKKKKPSSAITVTKSINQIFIESATISANWYSANFYNMVFTNFWGEK